MEKDDPTSALIDELEEVTDDISDLSWWDAPAILIFIILIILVWLQFFTRYVLNDSLSWTEEVSRYFLIWLTFIGGASCVRRGTLIALDFFYRYISVSWTKPLLLLSEIITSAFYGYCGYLAVMLAVKTAHQRMSSVDLPKYLVAYGVAFGCALMAIFALMNCRKIWVQSSETLSHKLLDNG